MSVHQTIYEFAVIRYVPRVERDEFINIGVILFSKQKNYLRLSYELDINRIKAFHSEADNNLIENYLKVWEYICKGMKEGGSIAESEIAYRFRWLIANRSTILQTSPVHPGLTNDLDEEMSKLMNLYVKC